jgi:hypothetical protein
MSPEVYDPFLALEQHEGELDLQAVFAEELSVILAANTQESELDQLFAKVTNLLESASEMLVYDQYLSVVQMAMNCGGHIHGMQDMLQKEFGTSATEEKDEHGHSHSKKTNNSHTSRSINEGWLYALLAHKKSSKNTFSFLDLILGVK